MKLQLLLLLGTLNVCTWRVTTTRTGNFLVFPRRKPGVFAFFSLESFLPAISDLARAPGRFDPLWPMNRTAKFSSTRSSFQDCLRCRVTVQNRDPRRRYCQLPSLGFLHFPPSLSFAVPSLGRLRWNSLSLHLRSTSFSFSYSPPLTNRLFFEGAQETFPSTDESIVIDLSNELVEKRNFEFGSYWDARGDRWWIVAYLFPLSAKTATSSLSLRKLLTRSSKRFRLWDCSFERTNAPA